MQYGRKGMSRTPRIEFEGAVYHVTNRGNGGDPIYRETSDWVGFLDVLSDVVTAFGWRLYGYCLMSNHYHLLLETPEANLSAGMKTLDETYTKRFNRAYTRTGHVFQGRYWAGLIMHDEHLVEAASYVLLNPVRAHLVDLPEQWQWSSCAAMAGMVERPLWLWTEWLPTDYKPQPGGTDNPFLSFVHQSMKSPRPANLDHVRGWSHRSVKTKVPDTNGTQVGQGVGCRQCR